MRYRKELDGLRGISVLSLLLFHAGFRAVRGGFVGVDVFFVLSGYLITSIIWSDFAEGSFSLSKFYQRRAKRILPALFFVLVACIPIAWMWLTPTDMRAFSESLLTVITFASNIFFWRETGYFDTAAELKPLLHTWSLAVEEQFYLFFPLVLLCTFRLNRRRVRLLIFSLLVLSFLTAEWATRMKPTAAYYLLPTRAWELLSGAFVALTILRVPSESLRVRAEMGALIGLTLIIGSIFCYDKYTPFPGIYAIAPVAGAVLIIIFAHENTSIGKLLARRYLVQLGMMSYSIYLWHQPIFAFARYRFSLGEDRRAMFALSLASILVGYLSWKFVENPLRFSQKSRLVLTVLLVAAFVGLSFGFLGLRTGGFPSRLKDISEISRIPTVTDTACPTIGQLHSDSTVTGGLCRLGDGPLTTAIIGDSHAAAILDSLAEQLKVRHQSAWAVAGPYCAPLLNGFIAITNCVDMMNSGITAIARNPSIQMVVLIAEWSFYTSGTRDGNTPIPFRDSMGAGITPEDNPEIVQRSLTSTVEFLESHHKRVMVLLPLPEFTTSTYHSIYTDMLWRHTSVSEAVEKLPAVQLDDYRARNAKIFRIFSTLPISVTYVDATRLFCDAHRCHQAVSGLPLFSDSNHVNRLGADKIVATIMTEIDRSR